MTKQIILALYLLYSYPIYTSNSKINPFEDETIDSVPTIEAYRRILNSGQKTDSPQSNEYKDNITLKTALQLAQKAYMKADVDTAIIYYKKVLEFEPSHFEGCFNLGNMYYNKNQPEEALYYYQQGLENSKKAPQYYYNMGLCYKQLKKYDEAIKQFEQAIITKDDYLRAYHQLGKTLHDNGEYKNAVEVFLKILENHPHDELAHRFLAESYRELEDFDKAIEELREAYRLRSKDLSIMLQLANLLTMRGYLDEALGLYQKARVIHPTITTPHYNMAYILKKQGYIPQAIEMLKEILKENPDHTQAHFSLGICYLTLGNFEEGWKEYEWRWETTKGRIPRIYPKPVWDGSDLHGKKILIYAEQGLGDTFQFIRYAKVLKKMGAYIIFKSRKELVDILSLSDYIDEIITPGMELPEFDFHIPLLSLPLVLKANLDTIPSEIPYLYADPKLVEDWKHKLAEDKNFKIGICWQGNANYSTQFLRQVVAAKSMNATFFEPIAKIPGVSVYSLQKIFGTEQIDEFDKSTVIHDFGPNFDDAHGRFMDTAAVIKNLNLIITIDTSISHLSAALGTPTWIILPEPADWRWMLKRLDTPWYPNVRLFRQPRPGDWSVVIEQVVSAVNELINSYASSQISPSSSSSNQNSSTIEGICDLENRDHQATHTYKQEIIIDYESLPLAEFIDHMTLTALAEKKDENEKETTQLLSLHNQYTQKYPQLNEYTQQLLYANRYLLNLQKQLEMRNGNILHPDFSEIARQASRATKYKAEIMNIIKKLSGSNED